MNVPSEKPLRVAPIWLRNVRSARGVDSAWVKELARDCGLEIAAIAGPEPFDGLESHLHGQIEQGRFSGFDWFTPERASFSVSPVNLHEGIRSIVSVGLPYYRAMPEVPDDGFLRGRIARYAWGADYHAVLKRRMADLLEQLENRAGRAIEGRLLVDTARIVDRAVAARSGLGWYGKHTCVIVPGYGSWVMLGELLLDLDLEPDAPLDRNCGQCRACLDRCPTGAIVAPYEVDSTRCISFQTIEQRGVIPPELRHQFGNWVFGCDECQDVCPYTNAAQESLRSRARTGDVFAMWRPSWIGCCACPKRSFERLIAAPRCCEPSVAEWRAMQPSRWAIRGTTEPFPSWAVRSPFTTSRSCEDTRPGHSGSTRTRLLGMPRERIAFRDRRLRTLGRS